MKVETIVALSGMIFGFAAMANQLWKWWRERKAAHANDRSTAIKAAAERDSIVIASSAGVLQMMQDSLKTLAEENARLRADRDYIIADLDRLQDENDRLKAMNDAMRRKEW